MARQIGRGLSKPVGAAWAALAQQQSSAAVTANRERVAGRLGIDKAPELKKPPDAKQRGAAEKRVGAEVGAMPARRVALVNAANHAFAPMESEKSGFTLGFIEMAVE